MGDDEPGSEPEPDADEEPAGMRTNCTTCRGEGVVVIARMAVINGQFGSAPEVKRCMDCDGSGWLPGFVTPA